METPTPPDIAPKGTKKANKIPKPDSKDVPLAGGLAQKPTLASVPRSQLPTPAEIQADVQGRLNDKIATEVAKDVVGKAEADFMEALYGEPSGNALLRAANPNESGWVPVPDEAANVVGRSLPHTEKRYTMPAEPAAAPASKPAKSAATPTAPMPKKQELSTADALSDKYNRYYDTRRKDHPTIAWVTPQEFARMTDAQKQQLYRRIYTAENSKAISPPVLSSLLVETSKYISSVALVLNAKGVLANEHNIGVQRGNLPPFYVAMNNLVKSGALDKDLEQFWCEYAGWFENAGPGWRIATAMLGAFNQSLYDPRPGGHGPAPMPQTNTTPLEETAARKTKEMFNDL